MTIEFSSSSINKLANDQEEKINLSNFLMLFVYKKTKSTALIKVIFFLAILRQGDSLYRYANYYLTSGNLDSNVILVLASLEHIYSFICILVVCKWDLIVEFVEIWSKTDLQDDSETRNYINRKRRKFRIVFILFCTSSASITALLNFDFNRFTYISSIKMFYVFVDNLIQLMLISMIIDFLSLLSIHIQAVFIAVDRKLGQLPNEVGALCEKLRSIRRLHYYGRELTRLVDLFIFYLIIGIYCIIVPVILLGLYRLIYESDTILDRFTSLGVLVIGISATVIVTFSAVEINNLASKCFDKVYELSFVNGCPGYYKEVSLMMYRMGRYDIGISFANLFIISSSFVTSLATLCVTFILAFPSTFKTQ
ncbi:uncharacterized protein LOC128392051 [Panonychus citri]|uniref:uncharacterized protein LOC128392051 n=1 Tax=Panonychus citri TaxID=50023 RepID=UPI0023076C66|nr:uncharacterized protein LOC128392051 [Panonychus citri]